MRPGFIILVFCIALATGCLAPSGSGPPPTPNVSYTPAQLKYLLLDQYGGSRFFFCDPDYYPIARGDERERAIETFPLIKNETGIFPVITARKGLQPPFSDDAKLIIYQEYKKLQAISLEPVADGRYTFSLQVRINDEGRRVSGVIRSDGTILIEESENTILTCPICVAGDTLIDTPSGPVQVKDIRAGTIVWSPRLDATWEAVPVLLVGKIRVPPCHRFVHLELADGRVLNASPGHPALDGRTLGSLATGDEVDGATVTATYPLIIPEAFTYDILPAGETGGYRANGIPLKSTLTVRGAAYSSAMCRQIQELQTSPAFCGVLIILSDGAPDAA